MAEGAYHGAAPWCTPDPGGTMDPRTAPTCCTSRSTTSSRSIAAVDEAGDDVAAIVVSPFRHDAGHDQELVDPDVRPRPARDLCDDTGAALILDDVRGGFRLAHGGSWEPIGVAPDLSAWSKAIANGYPLAAVRGNDRFRDGAERIFVTGSFWFSAVPMAAADRDDRRPRATRTPSPRWSASGSGCATGWRAQAAPHGVGSTRPARCRCR